MKIKISDLCKLNCGFQGKTLEGNTFKQITLKDVDVDGIIHYEQIQSFYTEKRFEKYLLKKGDILLKAKSGTNTAAYITEDIDNMVASAHFIILEVMRSNIIIPEYLSIYLNSIRAQEFLKRNAEGSALPIVKIKTLEEMEIDIIPMDVQEKVISLYRLMRKEKLLMEQIVDKRVKQFESYLEEIIDSTEDLKNEK